ncbi:hypothetical protein BDW60DRAFT_186171 [Aspergillus nidulans var. acristatus]
MHWNSAVRRPGDQYVGLTVTSLLAGLSDAERKKILLYLLTENTEPVDHSIFRKMGGNISRQLVNILDR